MDTLNYYVMTAAAALVNQAIDNRILVHTVTVTLNGAHGGADVTMEGTNHQDEAVTIEKVVR